MLVWNAGNCDGHSFRCLSIEIVGTYLECKGVVFRCGSYEFSCTYRLDGLLPVSQMRIAA